MTNLFGQAWPEKDGMQRHNDKLRNRQNQKPAETELRHPDNWTDSSTNLWMTSGYAGCARRLAKVLELYEILPRVLFLARDDHSFLLHLLFTFGLDLPWLYCKRG